MEKHSPKNPKRYLYKGENLTMLELCNISSVSQSAIKARINRGWTVEDAVNKPIDNSKKVGTGSFSDRIYKYNGDLLSIFDLAKLCDLTPTGIKTRINLGWSAQEAVETPKGTHPDGAPTNAYRVNADHNKALKRDKKLIAEHQQFGRCTGTRTIQ